MTHVGNVTTIVVSSACLVIWIGVTAYYGSWDSKNTNWDIMSVHPALFWRDWGFECWTGC